MFTYKKNTYVFNIYDINTERDTVLEKSINYLIDIDSLAVSTFVIPFDASMNTLSIQEDGSTAIVLNCYYSLKQKENAVVIAESLNEDHCNTVFQHVIQHIEKYFLVNTTDWSSTKTSLSVLSYHAIQTKSNKAAIMYSLDSKIMLNTAVRQNPTPLCSHFSNAPIQHYSKEYNYANDAKIPNCSNPQLNAHANGQLVPCPYNAHTQCPFYSKNETEVKLDYFYNQVIDNSPSKYRLVKSYYSDFSIEYTITVNDVEFTKIRRPYTQEQINEIEQEIIKVYEEVIQTTSNLVSFENISDNSQTKNKSYLLSLVSSEG